MVFFHFQYLCHAQLATMETCAPVDVDAETTTHVTSRMDTVMQAVRQDI